MHFLVYGLQRSGTNYTQQLIENNFESRWVRSDWKHDLEVYLDVNYRKTLVIIIHKNLYKWIESIACRDPQNFIERQRKYPADDRSDPSVLFGKNKLNLVNLTKTWNEFHQNYMSFDWSSKDNTPIWVNYKSLLVEETRNEFLNSIPFQKKVPKWVNIEPGKVFQSRKYTNRSTDYYLNDRQFRSLKSNHIQVINSVLDRELMKSLGHDVLDK